MNARKMNNEKHVRKNQPNYLYKNKKNRLKK